jgi:hypothetical protein
LSPAQAVNHRFSGNHQNPRRGILGENLLDMQADHLPVLRGKFLFRPVQGNLEFPILEDSFRRGGGLGS